MGIKDKFAESFARSKTMSEPERKANEVMGKLLLKKTIIGCCDRCGRNEQRLDRGQIYGARLRKVCNGEAPRQRT